MPVINVTPVKSLLACDTSFIIDFSTLEIGCALRIQDESTVNVTNYNYKFFIGASLVDEANTAAVQYLWQAAPFFAGQTVLIRQTITATEGTFIKEKSVTLGAFSGCVILQWNTTIAAPQWTSRVTSGRTYYVYDGSTIQTLTGTGTFQAINHSGLTGTTTIRMICPVADLSGLIFSHATAGQTGTIDISGLTALTYFDATGPDNTTSNFNNIINPASVSVNWTWYVVVSYAGTTLDISGIDQFSNGTVIVRDSNTLSTLTMPASTTGNLSRLTLTDFPATSLDISGYQLLNGNLGVYQFSTLTSLTTKSSGGGNITALFKFDNTPNLASVNWSGYTIQAQIQGFVTGASINFGTQVNPIFGLQLFNSTFSSLDISGLQDLRNVFYINGNTNLNSLTMPASTGTINDMRTAGNTAMGYIAFIPVLTLTTAALVVRMENMGLSAGDVNNYLVDLDAGLGAGSGTINIAGTNAAPTGAGVTAKNNLILKGYTVTTN